MIKEHDIIIDNNKIGINVFVRDKNGNLIARHNFCADDEKTLRSAVNAFTYAMETYCKDYIVYCSPIYFIFGYEEVST